MEKIEKRANKRMSFNKLRECPICKEKKLVIDPTEYVYKIGCKYYCSWTCYRKAQKEMEGKKKKSNKIWN